MFRLQLHPYSYSPITSIAAGQNTYDPSPTSVQDSRCWQRHKPTLFNTLCGAFSAGVFFFFHYLKKSPPDWYRVGFSSSLLSISPTRQFMVLILVGGYQNLVSDSYFHSLGYAYFKDKNRLSDVPAPPARARSASSSIVYFPILRSSCLEYRSQRGYNPAYLQIFDVSIIVRWRLISIKDKSREKDASVIGYP